MYRRNNRIKPFRAAAVGCIIRILLAAALCTIVSAQARAYHGSNTGVIVIDAGHGGIDGGTASGGLLEKDINLSLALKLKALLEEKGYRIVMTRDRDISLDHLNHASSSRHKRDLFARVAIINRSAAQIFISIHVNSLPADPGENGSIVYYNRKCPQGKALADYTQKELNGLKIHETVRKQQKPLANRYYILSRSGVPGILVETAFITNRREREGLKTETFLAGLAGAVAEGTDKFMKSESKESGAADVLCRRSI